MNHIPPEITADRGDIVVFIGLVLGLSWVQFIPPHLEGGIGIGVSGSVDLALDIVFMFSPVIAALVVVTWGAATEGPVAFLYHRFRWRVSSIWYVIALSLLPALAVIAATVYTLQGGSISLDDTSMTLLLLVFTQGFIANLFENYGWRGYLQEGLQATRSTFIASIVVGVVWGLWHAPLVLVDGASLSALPFGRYVALLVGLAVLFGWIYNESDGSVLLVTLMHCGFNGSIGVLTFSLIDAGGDVAGFITITAGIIWLAVGVVLVRTDSQTLMRVPGTVDE